MVSLCQNRLEGFGPHSARHPHLPTTCFVDVVVVPLPAWVFMALLLLLLPRRINPKRQRRASSILKPTKPIEAEPHLEAPDVKPRPATHTRILIGIYYFAVVVMLAMISLEIARLSAAKLGIGLLPFTYVGILAVLANRFLWKRRSSRVENTVFWAMLSAAEAVKLATEAKEGMNSRRDGRYPIKDEMTDVGVMLGVSVVLMVLEFAGWTALGPVE